MFSIDDRRIGIEVEVESRALGMRDARLLCESLGWEVVPDGSLRSGNYGYELRTTGRGFPRSELIPRVAQLRQVLVESSGVWRAAVHVHVSVQDLVPAQMCALLAASYATDNWWFERFAPQRYESNFCAPLVSVGGNMAQAFRVAALNCASSTAMMSEPLGVGYGKYSAINFNPVTSLGTVEFRHLQTPRTGRDEESILAGLRSIRRYASAAARFVQRVAENSGPCSRSALVPNTARCLAALPNVDRKLAARSLAMIERALGSDRPAWISVTASVRTHGPVAQPTRSRIHVLSHYVLNGHPVEDLGQRVASYYQPR